MYSTIQVVYVHSSIREQRKEVRLRGRGGKREEKRREEGKRQKIEGDAAHLK